VTARELKDRLYGRHPGGVFPQPGAWTCIEEWRAIDLLAWSAWSSEGGYRRVGYEVKVSRADLRRELLDPLKRARNVKWCNEFYLAVPAGLLTDEELAWEEPEWGPADFERAPCRYSSEGADAPSPSDDPGQCHRGKRRGRLFGPLRKPWGWDEGRAYAGWERDARRAVQYTCDGCGGRGWSERSRVELEAPQLWVPRDVGLVTVDGRGCTVERPSPVRHGIPSFTPCELGQLIRWVSMRPDPRHHPKTATVPA
jgi:hypothetical protein